MTTTPSVPMPTLTRGGVVVVLPHYRREPMHPEGEAP